MTNNSLHSHLLQCSGLEFDLELGVVKNTLCDTQRFSPINLKLLTCLLSRQGQVVSRAELFDTVWPNQILSDDVLTRAISDIRSQLAKLDDATKFVETLPKRGYRWVPEVVRVQSSNISTPEMHTSVVSELPKKSVGTTLGFVHMGAYLIAAVLLAFLITWWLSRPGVDQIALAVLPTSFDRPQNQSIAKTLDENLLQVLRNNPNLKLLSTSAVASRPKNPFPYFYDEFGTKWLMESRVKNSEIYYELELSLVDARTGIEVRSARIEFINSTESLVKLAKKLETDFFDESVNY